jgi:hypothetical protein
VSGRSAASARIIRCKKPRIYRLVAAKGKLLLLAESLAYISWGPVFSFSLDRDDRALSCNRGTRERADSCGLPSACLESCE